MYIPFQLEAYLRNFFPSTPNTTVCQLMLLNKLPSPPPPWFAKWLEADNNGL